MPAADDAAPPAATAVDARIVEQLAKAIAGGWADGGGIDMPAVGKDYLEGAPQSLSSILDGSVAACKAAARDEDLVRAYRWLLVRQLELIRYRAERGWPWASGMLEGYQKRLVDLAASESLDHADLLSLATALNDAHVPVVPALAEALLQDGPTQPRDDVPPEALAEQLRTLLDEVAKTAGDPFAVIALLSEVTALFPVEFRAVLADGLGLSPHPVLRDAVPLMLLDGESEVRRAAAAVLEQTAMPDTLSPVSLRRIILLRNWIPEDDRAGVDRVIRKARTNGVVCAQWAPAPALEVLASTIDGSGAQSLIVMATAAKLRLFCGLLLKQGFGIRDSWFDRDMRRRDIDRAKAGVRQAMACREVARDYLDRAVQHHIAVGLANGRVANPAVLDIAEAIGAADWKDRRIDLGAEIGRLREELGPVATTRSEIAASLKRSEAWMRGESIAESWFENDAEVRALAGGRSTRNFEAAVRAMLNDVLEKRRGVWAERFLLLALWARAATKRQGSAGWGDFLVLAHELSHGRQLAEIPVMLAIARRTVAHARSGAW